MVVTGEHTSWTNPILIAILTPACGCGCLTMVGISLAGATAAVGAANSQGSDFALFSFMAFVTILALGIYTAVRSSKVQIRTLTHVCRTCGHRWHA
jgi:hypothetical protein